MVRYHITPLGADEIRDYIYHRLNIAGPGHKIDFSGEAISAVWNFSTGTPRLINMLCDRALLAGYVCETNKIDIGIINQCIEELESYYIGGMIS